MWLDEWSNCGSTQVDDALDTHAVLAVGGMEQGCVQTTHEASSLTPPFTACIRAYGPMNHFLLPPFAAFVLPATVLRSNRHAMRSRYDESRSDRRRRREQNEQTLRGHGYHDGGRLTGLDIVKVQ